MDIKQLLSEKVQSAVKDVVVKKYGLKEDTANTAIDHAMTAVLSGLQKNVKSNDGAAKLDTALSSDHDGSILDNVNSALKNETLQQDGTKILDHIFGSSSDKVASTVSKASGTDISAASGILSTIAPLILGQLGKTKQTAGLDATGVADTLLRQQLPQGGILGSLAGLLDRDGDGKIVDDVMDMGSNLFNKK
jgi:hypothetical protein